MCGIIRVSASSKNRFNSSPISLVPSSLYSKHEDMLPSQFSVPLETFQMLWLCQVFQECATEFLKDNFACWTCPKSINLDRNSWCKRHVYHLKGLSINSASSLAFFVGIKAGIQQTKFTNIKRKVWCICSLQKSLHWMISKDKK